MADRRMVIRMALAAAIAPVLATRGAGAQSPAGRIAPPAGPMLYTRRLVRDLPGGARFSVSRSFRVRFTPLGSGYRIDGEQVSAHVEAPANLARFAELEEQRVERGIFPLFVDDGGYILGGEDPVATAEIAAAFAAVGERIRSNYYDSQGRAEMTELLDEVHREGEGLISQLPHDIFAPLQEVRREERSVDLPWGDSGAVTTSFRAERNARTGLMQSARREVTTALGGSMRHTLEEFSLSAT